MVKVYLKTGEERIYIDSVGTKSDARLLIINELEKTNQDTHYFSYAFEEKRNYCRLWLLAFLLHSCRRIKKEKEELN